MNLLHILNPRVFLMPNFQQFMMKALSTSVFVFALDALLELSTSILSPHIGLFVVVDDEGQFIAMALIGNSTTALAPGCAVLHFYNKGGTRESRKLLTDAIVQFAKAHGQTKIRGIDTNHKPLAFVKLFEAALGPATAKGQAYEFDISGGEH